MTRSTVTDGIEATSSSDAAENAGDFQRSSDDAASLLLFSVFLVFLRGDGNFVLGGGAESRVGIGSLNSHDSKLNES
ncbi:hypothetical protein [Burkholderia ubonensis]|uniref:hypothetical protein n=1 Tax=Burkholderia ubonensis TaxID=101571 RepID=UPI0011CFBA0D|nr:hypothetical protein [Burkholderia ubonensis]